MIWNSCSSSKEKEKQSSRIAKRLIQARGWINTIQVDEFTEGLNRLHIRLKGFDWYERPTQRNLQIKIYIERRESSNLCMNPLFRNENYDWLHLKITSVNYSWKALKSRKAKSQGWNPRISRAEELGISRAESHRTQWLKIKAWKPWMQDQRVKAVVRNIGVKLGTKEFRYSA